MKKKIEETRDERIERLLDQLEMANHAASYWYNEAQKGNGRYGTYEELSKKYEDLWNKYKDLSKDYQSTLKLLDTTNGRLAYQNMMLDKAREAYKYITEEDHDKQI